MTLVVSALFGAGLALALNPEDSAAIASSRARQDPSGPTAASSTGGEEAVSDSVRVIPVAPRVSIPAPSEKPPPTAEPVPITNSPPPPAFPYKACPYLEEIAYVGWPSVDDGRKLRGVAGRKVRGVVAC